MPTASQAQLTLPPGWIPPDYYGDAHSGSGVFRRNQGQVLDTQGNQRPDVVAQLENTPVGVYIRNNSTLSYTMFEIRNDSVLPDEGYRIDMTLAEGLLKTPELVLIADGIHNYYRGSITAENVPAYNRAIYKDVVPDIDIHIYSSKAGPRMTFVIRPGGNPETLQMVFNGQDSIKVDITGALKLFKASKWVRFEQVKAYQVNANNTITNVSWNATYEPIHNTATVGFNFGTYDTNLPLILQIGQPAFMGGGPVDERNLDWCTYAGGSSGDQLKAVEVDDQGDMYTCGETWSYDFPVVPGTELYTPFQQDQYGFASAVVMKVRASDRQRMWATYFGGSNITIANKLAIYNGIDSNLDYAFVTGSTNCTDLPIRYIPETPFADAEHEQNSGASRNMWVGAFSKDEGTCDWSTTHGATNGATWTEDGLAIAVDEDGRLAVGGMIDDYTGGPLPAFPLVTPTGAFARAVGGGFVMAFNPAYTIKWSSTFASLWHTSQITDMRITKENGLPTLWVTGSDANADIGGTLDCVPHPDGGYYQQTSIGTSMFLARFQLSDFTLDFCTRWGSNSVASSSVAYGLDIENKSLYLVGYTGATDITLTQCPDPGGPNVFHTIVHTPAAVPYQWSDGVILRFNMDPFDLTYGTLIGGTADEILLDVDARAGSVYITGETRSATGFSTDLNTDWYYQPQHSGNDRRDAILLSIQDSPLDPHLTWLSVIGGTESDRGWGIAATSNDVFVVGATSSYPWDEFPLHEYDPFDPYDFYQEYHNGGSVDDFIPWNEFDFALDFEHSCYGECFIEPDDQPVDGFIAGFNKQIFPVGLTEAINTYEQNLLVRPNGNGTEWRVEFPGETNWTLCLYDLTGREVILNESQNPVHYLNLATQASGLYVLRATSAIGMVRTAKIVRQ